MTITRLKNRSISLSVSFTHLSRNNDCPILFLVKITWFPGHFNIGNLLLSGMCSHPGRLLMGKPDLKRASFKLEVDRLGRRGSDSNSIILRNFTDSPYIYTIDLRLDSNLIRINGKKETKSLTKNKHTHTNSDDTKQDDDFPIYNSFQNSILLLLFFFLIWSLKHWLNDFFFFNWNFQMSRISWHFFLGGGGKFHENFYILF